MGFGIVKGFIEHLQIVATNNYSAIANPHTLQFTAVRTESFQSAVPSQVVAWQRINNVHCFHADVPIGWRLSYN
jgi:hypothetical protein